MPKPKPVRRVFVTKVPAANGNGGGLHVSNSGLAAIAAALAALATEGSRDDFNGVSTGDGRVESGVRR